METRPPADTPASLHIDRTTGTQATAEYAVSFGGSKDIVDTALLATPQGLDALTWVLVTLGVPLPEIEKAIRLLHESLHHDIPNVHLTRAALLRVGRLELAHRSRP